MLERDSTFTFVLFGGTGDLAMRKILPALFEAHCAGLLNEHGTIVGVARHVDDLNGYLEWVEESVKPHIGKERPDEEAWKSFLARLDYVRLDVNNAADFGRLRDCVSSYANECCRSSH